LSSLAGIFGRSTGIPDVIKGAATMKTISRTSDPRLRSIRLTWGDLGQECLDAVGHKQNSCRDSFGIQGLSLLTRPGYSLARSNSHSVAARGGCTNIPLAAGEAQEDETILKFGGSSHTGFRSVRPDPPGLIMSWKIREYCERLPSSHFHHGSFDNDAGGDIFPQRH